MKREETTHLRMLADVVEREGLTPDVLMSSLRSFRAHSETEPPYAVVRATMDVEADDLSPADLAAHFRKRAANLEALGELN